MADSSNSSNSSSSLKYNPAVMDVINVILQLLGDKYKAINYYNNVQQISLDGTISVQVAKFENLFHGNAHDFKLTVVISGSFLTAQDAGQDKITNMFNYILQQIDENAIKNRIDNCAGVLINTGTIDSNGQLNTCELQIELFICND